MKIEIFDISTEGEGIGREPSGKIVFVPRALPGESVEIEITEDKGRFMRGRRTDIGDAPVCGGCPLIDYPYKKQLEWKEKHVRDCLTRIAKLSEPVIRPIAGMDNPYGYRNKIELRVNEGLPYCNVNCKDCPIQDETMKRAVSSFIDKPVKNAEQLIIRTGKAGAPSAPAGGLVFESAPLKEPSVLAYTIQKSGYMLLYAGENPIYDYIDTDFARLTVEVDPESFYQVNSVQTGRLYSIAQKYAAPEEGSSILDLYCGCGTIGLSMAARAGRVIGVEAARSSVILANRNAVLNGIVNATFICGRAEDVVKTKLQGVKADIVILDPPRAGCRASFRRS